MNSLLRELILNLSGEPAFNVYMYCDKNPASGQTKTRLIHDPNQPMRELQGRLKDLLRGLGVEMPYATGSVPGRSIDDNLEPHIHACSRWFYLTDFKNAYPSVQAEPLAEVLCTIWPEPVAHEEMADFLGRYCVMPSSGLALGGPASPDLFNLFAHFRLDIPLGKLCARNRLFYTRYLDDLTISSPDKPIGKWLRRAIRRLMQEAGFQVHHKKSVVCDLAKGGAIHITGEGIRWEGDRPVRFTPRRFMRQVRGMVRMGESGLTLTGKVSHMRKTMAAVVRSGADLPPEQVKLVADFLSMED